jgi:hypothetical protein
MKPYGKKHKKSTLGIHDSNICGCEVCNNLGWEISNKRERKLIKTELQFQYEETDSPILQTDSKRL